MENDQNQATSDNIKKLQSLTGRFWKIKIQDGRILCGKLRCIDSGLNFVLSEVHEYKTVVVPNPKGIDRFINEK